MKLSFITNLIISQFIFLAILGCSDSDDKSSSCTNRQMQLNELRENIRAFAETSICNDDFECRFIAFGSKPCGGAWEYLIYTTSIDTLELTDMVNNFNSMEATYNMECGAISDCLAVMPPTGFDCQNNICIPIY